MIVLYKVENDSYKSIAVIDEETAIVTGSSALASYIRDAIEQLKSVDAIDVTDQNVMDRIRYNLEKTYNNGYIEVR